jgi:hypothetical protein
LGRYNPHLPKILGQEWVPIREQPLTLTPRVNLLEVGHGFTVTSNQTIQTARFYVQDWPPDQATSQVILASVYRQGAAELTGPIQSVVIPCSLGTASSASAYVLSGSATTIAAALFSPSDNAYVIVNTSFTPSFDLRFDTESYLPQLIGKRILGIDFLYTYLEDEAGEGDLSTDLYMGITGNFTVITEGLAPTNTDVFGTGTVIGRQTVGEIDYFWNAPSFGVEVLPWTPNRLRTFDNGSGLTARFLQLSVGANPPTANQSIWFGYAALEVFFCEEQRILFGGRTYGSGTRNYVLGANQITMRDLSDAANPVLAPGAYDLVIASADLATREDSIYPELNQVQQLYGLPTHPAMRLIRPFPLSSSVGDTFTKEETHLLPQVSLHTSGGPLTEVHVYGRQAAAQVYGTVTATQEIYDVPAEGAASYPWVRYYARRFGNTTVPLKLGTTSAPISGSSVEVTPTEFDELDEIVDGWKEVTLRFDTAPSMGAGTIPQWQWSAPGELVGSRWEVLGAYAPALSGAPYYPFNRVPSPHQLSIATYGMPVSGANVNLGWVPQYAPPVSATVDDQTADATLIFAQDLPMITGFSSSLEEQEMVGIGLDCGLDPCCIPTAIDYVTLTWDPPVNSGVGNDDFERVEAAGGWGTATEGGAYTLVGTATDYSVDETGLVTFSANNSSRMAYLSTGSINFDIQAEVTFVDSIASGDLRAGLAGRVTDINNNYVATIDVSSTGSAVLTIEERVGGSFANLAQSTIGGLSGGDGATLMIRFVGYGTFLKAKVWHPDDEEPATWLLEVTDASLLTGGGAGVFTRDNSAVTGHRVAYDNLIIKPPSYWFGHYELQRMDTVTTDWQTIMKATDSAVLTFNDYEARVGILSSYRIRAVDVYDFAGPWSSTVTATVPEPGVTIGCTGGHVLIFTSNEEQDGSVNLAYSSVWEAGQGVEETFAFPESQFVQLQAVYNRDYFTAFRPTERGGEQFSRTVLVQAAAIAPETLADFTGLRDMAWANTSYICVRDEDGNRWFATVLVPGGRVLRDRRLYMAPVEIIEVTDTPSEVDP